MNHWNVIRAKAHFVWFGYWAHKPFQPVYEIIFLLFVFIHLILYLCCPKSYENMLWNGCPMRLLPRVVSATSITILAFDASLTKQSPHIARKMLLQQPDNNRQKVAHNWWVAPWYSVTRMSQTAFAKLRQKTAVRFQIFAEDEKSFIEMSRA